MMERIDRYGNKVVISDYGDVILKMRAGATRRIGGIIKKNDGLIYSKTITNRHILKVNDSIGVNYTVLEMLPPGTMVEVIHRETWVKYTLPKEEIFARGIVKNFRKAGYEVQVFVERPLWKQEKVMG